MTETNFKNMFDLSGRVALVTGGSRGIGKAACLALAQYGADVVVTGISARNQKTVDEIIKMGRKSIFVKCDVSNPEDSKNAVTAAVKEFGRLDILVNNAGTGTVEPAEDTRVEEYDRVMAINLRGLFFMCQAAAKAMVEAKRGGRIINIGSIFGRVGSEIGASVYHASKGGIVVLTRALACEWAKYGILVNAIGPGFIKTEMTASIEQEPELYKLLRDRHALKRFGAPEEVAGAVVYFASDASTFVTGQNLYVDGGFTAW